MERYHYSCEARTALEGLQQPLAVYQIVDVEQDCPPAIFVLGACYQDGTGVEKDLEKAAELYRQALDAGFEPDEEEKPRVEEVLDNMALANPWVDMTAKELSDASGLSFGVPEGAENVIYRYMESDHLAEMQFTVDHDDSGPGAEKTV